MQIIANSKNILRVGIVILVILAMTGITLPDFRGVGCEMARAAETSYERMDE